VGGGINVDGTGTAENDGAATLEGTSITGVRSVLCTRPTKGVVDDEAIGGEE
jgi:hypothetical protein